MADATDQAVPLLLANQQVAGQTYIQAPGAPGFVIRVVEAMSVRTGVVTVPAPGLTDFVVPIAPTSAFAGGRPSAPASDLVASPSGPPSQLDFSDPANSGLLPAL